MQSISAWLHSLGLDQYARVFDDNCIDLEVLPSLSEPDLEKLGLPMGHRKKLLKAIADLGIAEAGTSAIATARETVPARSPDEQARVQGERRQLTALLCEQAGSTALSQRLDIRSCRVSTRRACAM
jgi:hypothetical protein